MESVEPAVYLVAEPRINWVDLGDFLEEADAEEWYESKMLRARIEAQDLIEAGGRMCYRSWKPGLNKNVTRVRTDQDPYLANIIKSGHGSVLEHANFTFIFSNVSRVFTHELVRHRAGSAFSQESLRYVRLDELKFWMPEWAKEDEVLAEECLQVLHKLEQFQEFMAGHFDLDNPGLSFEEKKARTSFMRRFAPEGLATTIMWTANVRTIRHVLEARTVPGAEEEIRLVFDKVGNIMKDTAPALFADFYQIEEPNGTPAWVPGTSKV
jgi:thymidylate synthase (FAD)